jgi:hypothetical protein
MPNAVGGYRDMNDQEFQRAVELVARGLDALSLEPLHPSSDRGGESQGGKSFEDRRQNQRQSFRAPCSVCFFAHLSEHVTILPGRTRNISTRGVSLISKRAFSMGEPVELRIALSEGRQCCMAGIAAHCRYAMRGYYEIGLVLRIVQKTPIFTGDLNNARATLSWLSDYEHPAELNPPDRSSRPEHLVR